MRFRTRRLCALLAALATTAAAGNHAAAAYTYIFYGAGPTTPLSTPATVWSPDLWGWNQLTPGGIGVGVVNPVLNGVNGWRLSDASASLPNPAYITALSTQTMTDAARDGWRFSASARYLDDFGTDANMGLSAYLGGREYHLMLDLNAGDLRATLFDETPRVYQLTTGGTGSAAAHRFELQNTPGTSIVAFKFDGQTIDAQWDGRAFAHESIVQWGNNNRAGSARGVMDFQEVTFDIGPFAEMSGDFDSDGDTDGRDFLVWQRTVGSTFDRTADANADGRIDGADLVIWRQEFADREGPARAVPEPSALIMALLTACVFAAFNVITPRQATR